MKRFTAVLVLLGLCGASEAQVGPIIAPGGSSGGGSSTITSGTTATSGCVAGGVLYSISNLVKCDGNLVFDNNILTLGNVTTAGRSTIKLQDTISGASATSNFLNITGIFPAVSAITSGVYVDLTTGVPGASGQRYGIFSKFTSAGLAFQEDAAILGNSIGTSVNSLVYGVLGRVAAPTSGNYSAVGVYGDGSFTAGATNQVVGVWGRVVGGNNVSGPAIGVVASATTAGTQKQIGLWATLATVVNTTILTSPAAPVALVADNDAITGAITSFRDGGTEVVGIADGGAVTIAPNAAVVPLTINNGANAVSPLVVQDNGTAVFTIGDGGNILLARTITAGGTTGAQTINKASGTVNFAAAATSLVVTNSLATADSIVFAVLRTNDTTCRLASVVPAAGSFTINMTGACAAETSVGFQVNN